MLAQGVRCSTYGERQRQQHSSSSKRRWRCSSTGAHCSSTRGMALVATAAVATVGHSGGARQQPEQHGWQEQRGREVGRV